MKHYVEIEDKIQQVNAAIKLKRLTTGEDDPMTLNQPPHHLKYRLDLKDTGWVDAAPALEWGLVDELA